MFTQEHRTTVLDWIRELAQADPRVMAGALIGSLARGAEDAWSDIDVAFGVVNGISLEIILDEWTQSFAQTFGVIDYFDLPSQSTIYRVVLLADGLEVDVSVTPEKDFGARGPNFQLLFGTAQQLAPAMPPEHDFRRGLCWHHVFHARSCIERGKIWQAEYWISALRDHTLELACLRLGESPAYGRGFDHLPVTVTQPFEKTLLRSLDEVELRRALAAATMCFINELSVNQPEIGERIAPLLAEFGGVKPLSREESTSSQT